MLLLTGKEMHHLLLTKKEHTFYKYIGLQGRKESPQKIYQAMSKAISEGVQLRPTLHFLPGFFCVENKTNQLKF